MARYRCSGPSRDGASALKICIVSPHDPQSRDSGDRIRTTVLASSLVELGHEVTVLFPLFMAEDVVHSEAIDAGVRFRGFSVNPTRKYSLNWWRWRVILAVKRCANPFALFDRNYQKSLSALLAREDFEVVDFQHCFTWIQTRSKNVCTVHNVESVSNARGLSVLQRKYVAIRWERRIFEHADHVVCFSRDDAERLEKERVPHSNVSVVPLAAGGAKAAVTVRTSLSVVGFVGSFDYSPNREAAEWLVKWFRTSAPAYIDSIALVGRKAKSLDLPADVPFRIRSDVPSIRDAVDDVDVLVCPVFRGGGVRVKIIEALSFGLPVVTTALGCEGLELEDGKNVRLFESMSELTDILDELRQHEKRVDLATHARSAWIDRYSPARMTSDMISTYRRVLDREV